MRKFAHVLCGEATPRTSPSSGQATTSNQPRHHRLLACHSGAAFGGMQIRQEVTSLREENLPEVGRPSSIVNLREQVVVGPVNHGYVLVVADQSQCKTGFRVISATALSVAHGKDRPMRGGSQNRPNDKLGHDPHGRAGRSFVNRLSLFLIKKGDFRWPK